MKRNKQQSAMEYLMTYGWSILIIAIVLAALFSLGVFSNSNLGPQAQPNSCRVFRPNGPYTTTNINLEGVCNGELPEYVAQFNGASSYISATNPLGTNLWYLAIDGSCSSTSQISASVGSSSWLCGSSVPLNTWSFVCFTYGLSSTTLIVYLNEIATSGSESGGTIAMSACAWIDPIAYNSAGEYVVNAAGALPSNLAMGSRDNGPHNDNFNGLIANVQIYNTTLDPVAVNALYSEGIGGAPIEPQYLVGWWPLGGDTNDYSGNANNGAPTSVTFTSSWTSGYTIP